MLTNFEQFVPSEVCLSCDGCCRFKEENSSWRPRISVDEQGQVKSSGLAAQILSNGPFGEDGHIKAVACLGGTYQCSFFEPAGSTCKIYQQRPFECQLYPFILTARGGAVAVYVHLNCPFVQEHHHSESFERYVAYLKEFFQRPEAKEFLSKNASLVGDYTEYLSEMEYLFTIPGVSSHARP